MLSAIDGADGIEIVLRLATEAPGLPGKRRVFLIQNEGIPFQLYRLENGIAALNDVGSFAFCNAVVREPKSIVIAHGIEIR